jgi:hypothetical protein
MQHTNRAAKDELIELELPFDKSLAVTICMNYQKLATLDLCAKLYL